jgi:hypothetical protein
MNLTYSQREVTCEKRRIINSAGIPTSTHLATCQWKNYSTLVHAVVGREKA